MNLNPQNTYPLHKQCNANWNNKLNVHNALFLNFETYDTYLHEIYRLLTWMLSVNCRKELES
jgi:hypothetical protein